MFGWKGRLVQVFELYLALLIYKNFLYFFARLIFIFRLNFNKIREDINYFDHPLFIFHMLIIYLFQNKSIPNIGFH